MEPTHIKDIVSASTLNLTVTVKSKSPLKSWTKNKAVGNILKGMMEDTSGTIDFVGWNENAARIDQDLIVNKTYHITNAKTVAAKAQYTTSKHKYQVLLEKETVIELADIPALVSEIVITPIVELLKKDDHSIHNVVEKAIKISTPQQLGATKTRVVQCRIEDNTGSIEVSFLGDEINKMNISINDVVLFENIIMRIFGQYRCLQANTGIRTINPPNRDFSHHMPNDKQQVVNLSPGKNAAQKKTVDTLSPHGNRQDITEEILETNVNDCIYDKCPKVKCRSRVFRMDNGLFRCNKCESDYLIATYGLRLSLKIGKEKKDQKYVILFDDIAEQVVKFSSVQMSTKNDDELIAIEKTILGIAYNMTVQPGKNDREYLCEKIEEHIIISESHNSQLQQQSPDENMNVGLSAYTDNANNYSSKTLQSTSISTIPSKHDATSLTISYDKPLNLSVKDNISTGQEGDHYGGDEDQFVNFNLEMPGPSTTPTSDDAPIDLTVTSATSHGKKYTFKRKLEFLND